MSKSERIPVEAIQAMKKALDALPDKNIGKTKEEALSMLNGQIQRAYSKGYSVKELAAILSEGKVVVSAPTLRAHTCPESSKRRKTKSQADISKSEAAKSENLKTAPARKMEPKKEPSFYTPDIPDTEL